MYGLPKDFNCSFLIGRTLEQICFSLNQVCMHFDNNISLFIESALSYRNSESTGETIFDIPVTESNLMHLIGMSVLNSYGEENGTLSIFFNNGHVFKCFDTSAQYESYQIVNGDDVTIV